MTDLGYYTGPIDGVWNQELTDSIKVLQRDLGVPQTGVFDAATLQAIYAQGILTGSTTTTTAPPETTAPPTTAPPVTAPPTTAPPTTAPPVTAPPTTVPPVDPVGTLLQELAAAGTYDTLIEIVERGRALLETVLKPFPVKYTVVAPLDSAFTADLKSELLSSDVKAEQFVLSLLIDGDLVLAQLVNPEYTRTGAVTVITDASGTSIGGALVVDPDRPAINGYIQGVDAIPTVTPTPTP
jgi:peptidoglycan hydrolase-like protein with peptidoglycan-binding domain